MAKAWDTAAEIAAYNVANDRAAARALRHKFLLHIQKIVDKIQAGLPDLTLSDITLPVGTPLTESDFEGINFGVHDERDNITIILEFEGLGMENITAFYPLPEYLNKLRDVK